MSLVREDRTPREDQLAGPRGPIVVYTAITQGYDDLKEQPRHATEGADFVAFLSQPAPSRTWWPRPIHTSFSDPVRNAKIHKILPHIYFPDAAYSVWIDGAVTIQYPHSIQQLVDLYLADCDLAVFQHELRTCIYQEAGVCLRRRLDDAAILWKQVCRYTREGYPPNAGLAECSVVLRRHTPAVNAFNETWWEEITRGSKRDQLSFPYVARKLGLRYGTLPGVISDNLLFHRHHHTAPSAPLVTRAINRARRHGSSLSARVQATMGSLRSTRHRGPQSIPSWLRVPARGSREHTQATALARAGNACDGSAHVATPRLGAAPAVRARTVAFGPVRDTPSWGWIGVDTARELSRGYDVTIYDSWVVPGTCDVLFVVKERPPERFVAQAQRQGTKLIYCPCDVYRDPDQLARDAGFLRACAMVLVHCERLLPFMQAHSRNVHFVEHHARYALRAMTDYKETGFILWIGGFQYVPYLVRWLEQHPLAHEIRILTDVENYRARNAARVFAAEVGVKLEISERTTSIAGCPLYPWSERLQSEMMRDCTAALDIKMTEQFEQYLKPPTKAQQFIASGIPFAVNPDSYSAEYFRIRGFDVASPTDTARWFSREYWQATQRAGQQLRIVTSLDTVIARYRQLVESL